MPVQYSRTLLSIASSDWTECVEGREERVRFGVANEKA